TQFQENLEDLGRYAATLRRASRGDSENNETFINFVKKTHYFKITDIHTINLQRKEKKKDKKLEKVGFEPRTSRMRNRQSTT
ncbi:unnamed protein product, partial [Heterotrigona itama]